ncbi:MAG: exopolysaccharide biosynthesis protein [Paracoccaceae bacterium]
MPPNAAATEPNRTDGDAPVNSILNAVHSQIDGEWVDVETITERLGAASFAPVLFLPAAAVVSPLSGVPGFSALCGVMIFLVAAQMAAGRRHLWLPGWLKRRRISSERLREAVRRSRSLARLLDRSTKSRLSVLMEPPLTAAPAIICMLCGAVTPFLELVPFTSSILGFAVLILSVAMLARDGLFFIAALGVIGCAAAAGLFFIL